MLSRFTTLALRPREMRLETVYLFRLQVGDEMYFKKKAKDLELGYLLLIVRALELNELSQ